ncbi:MAG: AAA family ATPase [Myxococcales bacterium]|nr:AAA family ATPase [Myxococcales bacterium]
MKLKRLDIHGFKSFYHRTTVVFDDGITAVVGPNGCGKSNIVDSIKWVMGEQGAKSLRGTSMEDVVFAGSEKRGPMGMCEVRLTFLNDGSAEVPARWQTVDEIAIERRLERSKGSDYLVNKQRCRLADIQDLLAGSGVSGAGGQRAYAIIEQGQIGKIVSAKADERRLLIEEAAGITRYRARKKQAERKMDETRANLERVDDIIGEVERQLRSLSRQAKKAERFREYRAEVRAIGLALAAFDYRALQDAVAQQEEAVRALTEADNDVARGIGAAEARRAATALAEKAADERARVATDALRAVEQVAHDAKGQLQLLEREAQTLMRQLETARSDLELGAGRRAELEGERAAAAAAVAELEAASEGQDAALAAREEAQRLASRRLLDAKADAERLRREAAEEAHQLARARAQRDTARARALDLRERAAGLAEERGVLEAQRGELRGRVEADTRALAEAEQTIAAARAAQAEAEARRQAAEAEAAEAVKTERALSERIAGLRSRLLSLEELERKREGLGEGNKAVLEAGLDGVLGTVPDALEVPAELEAAVADQVDQEVLYREALGAGLAQGDPIVRRRLGFLRERGRGARAVRQRGGERASTTAAAPAGATRLADRVPAGTAHPALVRRLLGDTLVVDDLDAALALSATWDGVVVTPRRRARRGRRGGDGGAQGPIPRR